MTDEIVGYVNPDGSGQGDWIRLEDLPDEPPAAPDPSLLVHPGPRKCRHPRDRRVRVEHGDGSVYESCRCGHVFDPAKQRRGRNVRKYGKKEELMDAREFGLEPRGTARDQEDSGGALDPAVVQSKTGPIHYPSAAWIRELDELGHVANGRPRILVATPKTGHGVKRRKVAVLYLDELQALTGLTARRKALEVVAAEARKVAGWAMGTKRLAAALEKLDACPR